MAGTAVISIFRTFSKSELRMFEDFLKSPFHNKNEKVIQFFSLIKKAHPEYADERLNAESLFKEMQMKGKYRESYVRNLYSDLHILAEKFLIQTDTNSEFSSERKLIEELNNRNLIELAGKRIKQFEKKIDAGKSRDQYYYLNKQFIYDLKSNLMVDRTLTETFRKDQLLSILKTFAITIMEFSFYLFVEEQRVKIRHDFESLKFILNYINSHRKDFEDSPLLLIFFHLCRSFFDEDAEKNFYEARRLFKLHFDSLSKADKKNIYSILQTFCIRKIDSGDTSFNKELLGILMEMLEKNVLSHKEIEKIDLNLYRNILILSFTLKDTKTLKRFISKYLKLVETESRSSIEAYSNAHLNYLNGDFDKALECCMKTDFTSLLLKTNENLFFKNDIKKLMLVCFYELNFFETALSHIDAYKHFLKNSKLIREGNRVKHINFLNLTTEMIRLKMKFDGFKHLMLTKKVNETNNVIAKDWLLEKLGEMR